MIRESDRIAVGVSGGKDSLALLDALLLLQKRSPVAFEVEAFTVEQGKFLAPIAPMQEHMDDRGVRWTYYRDDPSFQLLEEQPEHGCDMCSRYRRRAVYDIASQLGANVVALGHTADDFCESLLRNAMFTGRLSALPAVTNSRSGEFRLIRPLVFTSEEITSGYAEEKGIRLTPCVCRTGPEPCVARCVVSRRDARGQPPRLREFAVRDGPHRHGAFARQTLPGQRR
ncbi:MAG: ATP-binding protein [Bryobacterales bacterium]